jgi:hypothetical protein
MVEALSSQEYNVTLDQLYKQNIKKPKGSAKAGSQANKRKKRSHSSAGDSSDDEGKSEYKKKKLEQPTTPTAAVVPPTKAHPESSDVNEGITKILCKHSQYLLNEDTPERMERLTELFKMATEMKKFITKVGGPEQKERIKFGLDNIQQWQGTETNSTIQEVNDNDKQSDRSDITNGTDNKKGKYCI